LLAVLRDRQWAQDLTADDVSTNCRAFSLFTVSIELTAEGLKHVVDILQMLFHYTDSVLEHIPDWVHDELKTTGDTGFRFLAKHDAANTCSGMAVHMHQFAPEHYLSGAYRLYEYDPVAVQAVGQCLRSSNGSNLLVLLGSPDYEGLTDQVDKWYGTKFRVVSPSDSANNVWLQLQERLKQQQGAPGNDSLLAALALPAQNDMLPTDFSLVADKADSTMKNWWKNDDAADAGNAGVFAAHDSGPRCLIDTATCRLWYKPDANYQTPKVNLLATLRSSVITGAATPEAAVLASLWVEVVTELCNEFSYAASMAGLHCGFQNTALGMEIQVSGYNHKAGILLQRICDTVKDKLPAVLTSDEGFFERMRKKLEQQYQSALVAQPYQHGSMAVGLVLEASNKGFIQTRLSYLTNKQLLTSSVLLHFSNQLLSSFQLELLVHGNATVEQAKEWTSILLDSFEPVAPLRLPSLRGVELPCPSSESIYRLQSWNEHDENSCVVNIYQVGPVDIRTNATLSLLLQLLREPAFNILRTEEQLGYIVFTSIKTCAENIKSLMFLVQSDSFDPIHVDERIEKFLVLFRTNILVRMSQEEFQANVDAVCDSMLERNKNLSEESSKHWSVITNRTYHFRRLQDIAKAARTLTKMDIMRFFDRYVLAGNLSHRRKLSVQIFGTAHDAVRQELLAKAAGDATDDDSGDSSILLIGEPEEFVRGQSLYPAQLAASVEDMMLVLE